MWEELGPARLLFVGEPRRAQSEWLPALASRSARREGISAQILSGSSIRPCAFSPLFERRADSLKKLEEARSGLLANQECHHQRPINAGVGRCCTRRGCRGARD